MKKFFELGGDTFLKVRISVSMLQCTYSCEYCVAASGQSQTKGVDCSKGMARPEWGENGLELSQKAIEWVTSLPYRVGVRYDVHGEPFLSDEVITAVSWLTRQENVAFVEVQTNASMFRNKIPEIVRESVTDKINLFCTFHHSQVSPEDFVKQVVIARDQGVGVVANVLVFDDNLRPISEVLRLCRENGIMTSADIRYPGFTVPPTGDGKRVRHFLKKDPVQALLESASMGQDAFTAIADSGPLGRDVRFLAAFLVGLYGAPGRLCSAGHDYIFVDKWGDVYPCFCYADINRGRMGSVLESGFVPDIREEVYASCQYKETCHQKEEYGNLKVLREHRNLRLPSLNCLSGAELEVSPEQLYACRMAMIELARHSLQHDREGLFVAS